jgi:nickel/cobalt transporter (NicO) family protein
VKIPLAITSAQLPELVEPDMNKPATFRRIALAARLALTGLALSIAVAAHPMGNFSVNHYSRLHFRGGRAELTYVLDLAEIPAFQLLSQWQIDWKSQDLLTAKSEQQAAEWVANLKLTQAGRPLPLHIASVSAKATEGAGGMPILRIAVVAGAPVQPGSVSYEDGNYPGRAGWKEIVLDDAKDISKGLTYYPTDPGITPPQDVTARAIVAPSTVPNVLPNVVPHSAPNAIPVTPPVLPPVIQPNTQPTFTQQQPTAPGTVVRGDYLSRLLQRRNLGWQVMLFGILAAFGLGSMHALSPGHGKTIVAAYLVGSRGTLKHAGLLGFVVTFTHTFTVFLLGLGVLFFQQYIVPEKIVPVLGVISGLSIVGVGALLLYRRSMALLDGGHGHTHSHDGHSHTHTHQYARRRSGQLAESTEPEHTHSHMPEGSLTPGSLIALGVSGGLVPCPSALVLMLSAIALGHPGLGLVLLIAFSSGLAAVLMGIGMLALYARNLLPGTKETAKRPVFQLIPVFSAVVVMFLGLAMSAVSAGWIQPMRFLS